jgi:hypothetical protein
MAQVFGNNTGQLQTMAPVAQAIQQQQQPFQPTISQAAYNAIPWNDDTYYGEI